MSVTTYGGECTTPAVGNRLHNIGKCPRCGKVQYSHFTHAAYALKRAREYKKHTLRTANVYRCPHCRRFHIGTGGGKRWK